MLYAKKINLNNKNDSLSQIYNMVDAEKTVLDVGCACGNLSVALAKNKNCCVYGIEFNPDSVERCKNLKIFEKIWQYDLNVFRTEDFTQFQKFFDVIICADVMEHLTSSPVEFLLKIQRLLKSEGKIIVSLPNIAHASIKANLLLNDFTYTEMGILDKTHLHFYTYKSIAEILTSAGLRIDKIGFVTLPFDGWQPYKQSKLPKEITTFIAEDKHSSIMQYIMQCSLQNCSLRHNIKQLDSIGTIIPQNTLISKIKRILMTKCPYIIKYLEKIRK